MTIWIKGWVAFILVSAVLGLALIFDPERDALDGPDED